MWGCGVDEHGPPHAGGGNDDDGGDDGGDDDEKRGEGMCFGAKESWPEPGIGGYLVVFVGYLVLMDRNNGNAGCRRPVNRAFAEKGRRRSPRRDSARAERCY